MLMVYNEFGGGVMMKVLLVNGSPHLEGCTYTALMEIKAELEKQGIDADLFQVGPSPIGGCLGCGACRKLGHCFMDDKVNALTAIAKDYDGFVFGTPVHYASSAGNLTSLMDRAFYSNKDVFMMKPACAIVSCRRSGATATFDQINKYFTINNMPIVPSQYWNNVHGNTPSEVKQDLEGMQIMRTLARNMAWLLKCIEAGKKAGIEPPVHEPKVNTNFIR